MRVGEQLVRGFTLVWVLMALAVFSVGLAAMGTLWSADAKREREAELIRIGLLYAHAIEAYYKASPGTVKRYPPSVNALLLDTRFGVPVRHLRRPYPDPAAPKLVWGELRGDDGGLRGVYSQSAEKPLREQRLDLGILLLPAAVKYSDWHFVPQITQ
jgi:type II secretory pathway pseudopilin PulG